MIPLFGVVLAGVPATRAGLAIGVLTTTQQVGLGLGAAGLDTLLFALVGPVASWQGAAVVTFLVEAALSAVTAVAAWLVPAGGRECRGRIVTIPDQPDPGRPPSCA